MTHALTQSTVNKILIFHGDDLIKIQLRCSLIIHVRHKFFSWIIVEFT